MLYQIFLGLISGIVLVTTIHFLLSKNFSKLQKIILGILFLLPPAQWILGFIFWGQKEVRKNYPITNNDKNRKIISELEHLKAIGLLSKEEYEEKLKNINSQIKEIDIKKSEEYKSLVNLRENGILSDSEFNNKLNDLKQIHKQKNNPQKQGQESYSDEDAKYGYKIVGEKEKVDIVWGNFIEYAIEFLDGRKGEVYKGGSSRKYFYMDLIFGKKYYDNFEQSVHGLYMYLRQKNNS